MKMDEFKVIENIIRITDDMDIPDDVVISNGDDCFGFNFSGTLITTTDTMVDGIHFLVEKFSPYDIGVKSALSNISDISAMGGIPLYALVSLIIPPFFELEFILDVYKGMKDVFSKYNIYIGGGNISRGRDFTITLMLIGKVEGKAITRSGAKPGDLIFVSGSIGDSSLGLEILLKKGKGPHLSEIESYLVSRHINPSPRVELAQSLVGVATSCIDISDGFIQDLEHILESSGVGAQVFLEKIPTSSEYSVYISREKTYDNLVEFFKYPLAGGEDYELIFTVSPDFRDKVVEVSKNYNVRITEVGVITNSGVLELKYFDQKIDPKKYMGWKHF